MKNIHGIQLSHFMWNTKEENISINIRGDHGSDEDYFKHYVQSSVNIILPLAVADELVNLLTNTIAEARETLLVRENLLLAEDGEK